MKDFTKVETIYQKTVRTLTLRLRRVHIDTLDIRESTVHNPDEVYDILHAIFRRLDVHQEHMVLLILSNANEVTGFKVIASGTQDSSLVDCKVLFRNALLLGARSIIIAHNHPSGNPVPSVQDLSVTKHIAQAGQTVDVQLMDHIIYTDKEYTSLRNYQPDLFQSCS